MRLFTHMLFNALTPSPERIGKNSEKLVGRALKVFSDKHNLDYLLLSDFSFVSPSTGEINQIDHIYINKSGIFIIEVKNWKGYISSSLDNPVWCISARYSGKVYKTYPVNPIIQNVHHKEYVSELIKDKNIPIYDVVVFVSNNVERNKYENVIWYKDLFRYLEGKTKEDLLSNEEIISIGGLLEPYKLER